MWKSVWSSRGFTVFMFLAFIAFLVSLALFASGCKMFEVESPRPEEHQTEAAREIVNTNVPVIVGAQTDKQGRIKEVAVKALEIIGVTTSDVQAKAITNITANAVSAIKDADGTGKNLSKIMGGTNKDILTMNVLEYAAYAGTQSAVALDNRQKLYKGIETVKGLATSAIATYTGGGIGMAGLLAFGLKMLNTARKRKQLLVSTGSGVEEFAASNPEEGAKLKAVLAKKAAKLPIDAGREFDIT